MVEQSKIPPLTRLAMGTASSKKFFVESGGTSVDSKAQAPISTSGLRKENPFTGESRGIEGEYLVDKVKSPNPGY